jgi:hypothetical protein
LLCALHGCGGDEEGVGPAPDGLTVKVGEKVVSTGSLGVDLTNVPTRAVYWVPQLGSGVQNNVGSAMVNMTSVAPDGTVGTPLQYPKVEGDGAEAFQLVIDDVFASQFLVYVQCTPPGPGVYEADLVSGLMGVAGSHHTRMRCSTAEGYAMVDGTTMPGASQSDELLFVGGKRVHRSTLSEQKPTNYPDLGAWELYVGPVTADGKKLPFVGDGVSPHVTPAGSYRYYAYEIANDHVVPLLSVEEAATLSGASGLPRMNHDGTQLFFTNDKGVYRKTIGGELKSFTPAAPPQNALGTYHLLNVSGDGRYAVYSFANMISAVAFDALWILDTQTGQSEPLDFVDAAGARIAGSPQWVTELVFTPDMRYVAAAMYNQGSVSVWLYDRESHALSSLFESAKRHVRTLAGMPGSIMIGGSLTLSADGKYATILLNDYTTTSYWAGPKGVYVTETGTGKTYSFGVLPDGTPLSGDGWIYQTSGISPDGSLAHASVFWTGGVSGDGIPAFTLIVKRDRWVEIPQ